jgi:hypothetical protein
MTSSRLKLAKGEAATTSTAGGGLKSSCQVAWARTTDGRGYCRPEILFEGAKAHAEMSGSAGSVMWRNSTRVVAIHASLLSTGRDSF